MPIDMPIWGGIECPLALWPLELGRTTQNPVEERRRGKEREERKGP
jgi:hypothetical protein